MKKVLGIVVKILFGCILFAGLPIVGWGVADVRGFLENPARIAYVAAVIVLQILVVVLDPAIGRQGAAGKTEISRQRLAILLLQILSIAIVLLAPFSDRHAIAVIEPFQVGRYIGVAVFCGGFVLMNAAEAALDRNFSIRVTVQKDHRLVSDGLFAYVRNPRYLGIILANIGLALVFRSELALALSATLIVVLLWRIHDEEQLMEIEFGEAWRAYCRRTRRLIPFIF
jgi:protein-S-isoprenylcysteine O-methyltransferase Ste14